MTKTLLVGFACVVAVFSSSCSPVGACTAAVATNFAMPDGGTETCLCTGPCGCGLNIDGGVCQYGK